MSWDFGKDLVEDIEIGEGNYETRWTRITGLLLKSIT